LAKPLRRARAVRGGILPLANCLAKCGVITGRVRAADLAFDGTVVSGFVEVAALHG
jgi:hypothetical protein